MTIAHESERGAYGDTVRSMPTVCERDSDRRAPHETARSIIDAREGAPSAEELTLLARAYLDQHAQLETLRQSLAKLDPVTPATLERAVLGTLDSQLTEAAQRFIEQREAESLGRKPQRVSADRCGCTCRGCRHFHLAAKPAEGEAAHHARLLMAFDLSLAATCRRRAMPACNGQGSDDPHATSGCEMGSLHSRAGELAVELATAIEDPSSDKQAGRVGDALAALLIELRGVIGDWSKVS
jgi:hypothetical protein